MLLTICIHQEFWCESGLIKKFLATNCYSFPPRRYVKIDPLDTEDCSLIIDDRCWCSVWVICGRSSPITCSHSSAWSPPPKPERKGTRWKQPTTSSSCQVIERLWRSNSFLAARQHLLDSFRSPVMSAFFWLSAWTKIRWIFIPPTIFCSEACILLSSWWTNPRWKKVTCVLLAKGYPINFNFLTPSSSSKFLAANYCT